MPLPPRSSLVLAACLAVAAFGLSFGHLEGRNRMGLTFEFPEYSDIAREAARGNGFTSHVQYPSVLAFGDQAGTVGDPSGTYPVMNRHPGFALALAPFVAAFGDTDRAIHLGLAVFFALWVLVAFRVIDRRLGRLPAVVTAALLILNPAFVVFFIPGGFADILFAVLVLLFLDRCARTDDPASPIPWRWFALGLLGAAAWMVRFNFSLLAVLGAVSLVLPRPDRRRTLAAAALLLGFAFGCAPFQAWHTWTFGTGDSPPTLWNLLDGFPGYEAPWKQYRVLGLSDVFDTGLWRNLLTDKFPYFLFLSARNLPTFLLCIVPFPFFVAALFRRGRDASNTRFLALATTGFAAMLLVMSLFRFEAWSAPGGRELTFRYFIWFVPILVAFGTAEAVTLLAPQARPIRIAVLALLATVQLAYLAAHWDPLQQLYQTSGRFEDIPAARALAQLDRDGILPSDRPVFTNVPAHVGWYLDRPALLMTTTPAEIGPLWTRHPVAGMLFTRLDIGEPSLFPEWVRLFTDTARTKEFLEQTGMKIAFADDQSLLLVAGSPPSPATP